VRATAHCPMSQASADASVAGLPFIEADLKFKAGTHESHASQEAAPTPERVRIYDARSATSSFRLEEQGFELVEKVPSHPLSHSDFYDSPDKVLAELYPQIEKMLLARLPGATRVLIFDHLVRNRSRLDMELKEAYEACMAACDCAVKRQKTAEALADGAVDSEGHPIPVVPARERSGCHQEEQLADHQQRCKDVQPKTRFLELPLGHVHGDYTVRSGLTRARQLLQPYCSEAELERALSDRFAIVNVWHPIGPDPVVTDPLTMCVWGSFRPADVMTKRLVFPHRVGETYQALPSASHRWVYYSRMTRDEAILFKTFDSVTDDGATARFSIHSAFRTPAQAARLRRLAQSGILWW